MPASSSVTPIEPDRGAFLVPDEVAHFNPANLAPKLRRVRDADMAALDRAPTRGRPHAISATWVRSHGRFQADGINPTSSEPMAMTATPPTPRRYGATKVAGNECSPPGGNQFRGLLARSCSCWTRSPSSTRHVGTTVPVGPSSQQQSPPPIADQSRAAQRAHGRGDAPAAVTRLPVPISIPLSARHEHLVPGSTWAMSRSPRVGIGKAQQAGRLELGS